MTFPTTVQAINPAPLLRKMWYRVDFPVTLFLLSFEVTVKSTGNVVPFLHWKI